MENFRSVLPRGLFLNHRSLVFNAERTALEALKASRRSRRCQPQSSSSQRVTVFVGDLSRLGRLCFQEIPEERLEERSRDSGDSLGFSLFTFNVRREIQILLD